MPTYAITLADGSTVTVDSGMCLEEIGNGLSANSEWVGIGKVITHKRNLFSVEQIAPENPARDVLALRLRPAGNGFMLGIRTNRVGGHFEFAVSADHLASLVRDFNSAPKPERREW